jgi:signal transduction histidine kinase
MGPSAQVAQPHAQDRDELSRLVEEQAALRRVATLVAGGGSSAEVFEAVAQEVAQVLHLPNASVCRYDDEGTAMTVLAIWGEHPYTFDTGSRWLLDGPSMSLTVFRTGRPARVEDYTDLPGTVAAEAREHRFGRVAGAPIIVDGRVWGVISTSSPNAPFADDLEDRLVEFTELVATAIANSQAHEELTRLAEEQAALRRVATLVAQGRPPAEVFEAVSAEVGRLVPADAATLVRYERDGMTVTVGSWSRSGGSVPVGSRHPLDKAVLSRIILETRRPARVTSYAEAGADLPPGWRSGVGAPVIVEGDLWGAMGVGTTTDRPLPPETERRLTEFTELLATAIANVESRAELGASRARIVATADATRRRIERDLHDGAQQRLISLALELRAAQAAAPSELPDHRAELAHIAAGLTNVLDGLREIALGIHPAVLAEGGLGPAVRTLAHASPIPVEFEVKVEEPLPEPVELAAYYVVSEALTNAAKYGQASTVNVSVEARDDKLIVSVDDNGVGGADPNHGSGLLGLKDRAEAIGGKISLRSLDGEGTSLYVELPLRGGGLPDAQASGRQLRGDRTRNPGDRGSRRPDSNRGPLHYE